LSHSNSASFSDVKPLSRSNKRPEFSRSFREIEEAYNASELEFFFLSSRIPYEVARFSYPLFCRCSISERDRAGLTRTKKLARFPIENRPQSLDRCCDDIGKARRRDELLVSYNAEWRWERESASLGLLYRHRV
jgi:hypothetical protein